MLNELTESHMHKCLPVVRALSVWAVIITALTDAGLCPPSMCELPRGRDQALLTQQMLTGFLQEIQDKA